MTMTNLDWQAIVELHDKAIANYTDAALQIPATEWARAENEKWAPAHLTEHLSLVYETLLRELEGGPGMKVRTNFVVRQLLRWFYVPGLLNGKPFPKGARAPRETRPVGLRAANKPEAVQALKELSERFQTTIQRSYQSNPRKQLTHAYFGRSGLSDCLLLCARHIQHHTKQIERI